MRSRRELRIVATSLNDCPGLQDYIAQNPDPGVFPRSLSDLLAASANMALIHAEFDGDYVGVGGVFEQEREIHDIGGFRVTMNGRRIQRLIQTMLALQTHLANERYTAITTTTFADNKESLANIRSQFDLWREAPVELMAEKSKKAAGRPFKLFYAPSASLIRMAEDLLELLENPILTSKDGTWTPVVFDHPLISVFRGALEEFVESSAEERLGEPRPNALIRQSR